MEKLKDTVNRGFYASFKEGGDVYLFEVGTSGLGREYAAVFLKEDSSHYTAAIIPSGKKERFSVRAGNLVDCVSFEMVDILTDEVFFKAPFSIFTSKEDISEQVIYEIPLHEDSLGEAKEVEVEEAIELPAEEREDTIPIVKSFIEENLPPAEEKLSRYEENERFFAEKLTYYNFGDNLPGQHRFYVYDSDAALYDIKINLTDSTVSAQSIFAGYRNGLSSGDYPPRIIGNITHRTSRYFVFGIFGLADKEFQPFGGVTGFAFYAPLPQADQGGYWLMYINADTGRICLPKL